MQSRQIFSSPVPSEMRIPEYRDIQCRPRAPSDMWTVSEGEFGAELTANDTTWKIGSKCMIWRRTGRKELTITHYLTTYHQRSSSAPPEVLDVRTALKPGRISKNAYLDTDASPHMHTQARRL